MNGLASYVGRINAQLASFYGGAERASRSLPAPHLGLLSLRAAAISNRALGGEKLPARIKILNWGDNPSVKGNFCVGRKTLARLPAMQTALGFDRVAIDYNHSTVPNAPGFVAGSVPPIFGYGRVNVVENEGIFLEDVTWTPLGVQHARNFEDLSPALLPNTPGEEVHFIHSVALTPNGALRDVSFFSAAPPG